MALRVSLTNLYLLLVIIFGFICLLCLQLLQPHHHTLRFASAYVHLTADYKPIEHNKSSSTSINASTYTTKATNHAINSFSREVNHYKYRPNPDFEVQLPLTTLIRYAAGASASKGRYVEYRQADFDFDRSQTRSIQPSRMFRYEHNTPLCHRHYISLKYTPECGLDDQLDVKFVKPLLIVAVQRSGIPYDLPTIATL